MIKKSGSSHFCNLWIEWKHKQGMPFKKKIQKEVRTMTTQKGYGVADKVLMIGIDGMDPLYTKKLLQQGKLPNIAEFIKRGTTTKDIGMMGVLPAYTPPSWCTLATGAWPGTPGITDFWNHKSGDPLNKLSLGFNSNLCKVDYAWDTFAKAGKKVIVYGWPTSWPPRDTENTIMVD